MYFPNGEEFSGIIEVEGFKFRKHVTRQDDYILIEITDMTYKIIAERAVYKNEAQRLEDENIELKAQIKDLEEENNKIPLIHFNTSKTTDEEEVLIVD
ncbi:DUF1108 family protein [Staphylococcus pseudintermedius]|nr:DUF1108 family protein [Staphylococcus pseudintermedius]